jgi:sarcosine oxidase
VPAPRIAVIGAGVVGLSAAVALLGRGAQVTVIERGAPGSEQSHGPSRIFQHAHDDPRLVRLARRSGELLEGWGAGLLHRHGVVLVGDAADEQRPVCEAEGVEVAPLSASALRRRLPVLGPLPGEAPALLDATAGTIAAEACVRTLAGRVGSRLRVDEVHALQPLPGAGVEVIAAGTRERFDRVVVCAGRDTRRLGLGVGVDLPVSTGAQVKLTFRVAAGSVDGLPPFQDSSGLFGESGVYGVPVPGGDRYAVGHTEHAEAAEDGSFRDPGALAELERRIVAYVSTALPGLVAEPVARRQCWVTVLPWSSSGLAIWSAGDVHLVAGHHLFKLAPALGEALAAAALDGAPPDELRPEARPGAA